MNYWVANARNSVSTSQSLQGIRSFSSGRFEGDSQNGGESVSIPSRNQVFFIRYFRPVNAGIYPSVSIPSRNQVFFMEGKPLSLEALFSKSQSLQGIRSFSYEDWDSCTGTLSVYVSIPSRNQVFFIKAILRYGIARCIVSIPSRNQVFFILTGLLGVALSTIMSQSLQGIRSFS